MSDHRVRSVWMCAVAVAVLVGGCTATTPPDGAAASASPTALAPLLPFATSAAPADLAVDRKVAAVLDAEFASEDYPGVVSVLVLADGRTVFERYFDSAATDHHRIWSVTKSVTSTLIGIAIGEGMIPGVDATLAELLPDHAPAMTPVVAGITLEQLLTMTAGFADAMPSSDDTAASILKMHYYDPGTEFYYSNTGPSLVAAILVQATGMPVLEYARAALFDPLGIPTTPAVQPIWNWTEDPATDPTAFGWLIDPNGLHAGGIGLRLRGQDMAKIGLLYLNKGTWQGQQIVPAEWTQAATTQHVALVPGDDDEGQGFAVLGEIGYGYLWWTSQIDGDPIYWAYGVGGQKIIVIPDRDLVVTYQVETDPGGGSSEAVDTRLQDTFISLIAPAYK